MELIASVTTLHIALLAGLLQLIGYIIYISRSDIEPEPLTWLMWGSTTWIIAVMEADSMVSQHVSWAMVPDAERALLLLPVVCGCMAAVVAMKCWRKGTIKWPSDWQNKLALVLGFGFTAMYILGWYLSEIETISNEIRILFASISLTLLNLVAIIEFSPIIRNTKKRPQDEKPLPWAIWCSAYTLLFLATYLETGVSELLVYPLLNAVLHGAVGYLSLLRRVQYT